MMTIENGSNAINDEYDSVLANNHRSNEHKNADLAEVKENSSRPSSSDMAFYYEKLLPFRSIFQWLSHSPKVTKNFSMREFAYEFRSGIYQRYNSFSSMEEFKNSVITANPTRFEIGAVYSVNPKERKNVPKSVMKPLGKEMVFDIDLTDYDDIRTCCSDKDICKKCWKFIQVAAKILDKALREDFDFQHIIWVFSGRRGAHCWISDDRACKLDEAVRKSIVDYLDVLGSKSLGNGSKKLLSLKRPFHPHIERSFEILKKEFINIILIDQDPWLTTPETGKSSKEWKSTEELISFIPDITLQQKLKEKWSSQKSISTSRDKWEDIQEMAKKTLKNQAQVNQLNEAKKEIIICYLYPRLDVEVSRQVIHLLKSPFCIHPSTGNVCVPFDPYHNISGNSEDEEYGFNPTNSPNLRQLQNEIEKMETTFMDTQDKVTKQIDYEHTSLRPYVEYFAKFVRDLIKDELKQVGTKRQKSQEIDF